MAVDRRTFLGSGLAAGAVSLQGKPAEGNIVIVEPATKADVATPALLLDLDRFEANLQKMADHAKSAGVGLRPHAKTHKCPEVARRQLALGAKGISVATVDEACALADACITGILLTSPVIDPLKLRRIALSNAAGKPIMVSLGHPREADLLAEAARAAITTIDVLIDVDVGDHRTGTAPGEPAIELARHVAKHKSLRVVGVQAYSGSSSHVVGHAEREAKSRTALAAAVETRKLLDKAGFNTTILSVGSTGTYNIDSQIAGVTELQCGSYAFMDVDYRSIGSRSGNKTYDDFQPSLTVITTVVNVAQNRVSIDAGTKALDTTTNHKPDPVARPGISYARGGDEFGIITAADGAKLPEIGERLEFIVPHCDPSINLYDCFHVFRGDKFEGIWPILARRAFPPLVKSMQLAILLCLSLAGFASAQSADTADSLRQRAAAVVAKLEGEIIVPGLKQPVEVLRDRWGIPHIYAQNDDDLFFAQGFVVAQDRLFQLDVWRRVNIGETAAILGEKGMAGDRFARLMKYRGPADAEWMSYSPEAKQIAEAFTRGINASIDAMGDRLPIEFELLGYKPARWSPEDILGRMSGLIMSGNHNHEARRAQLIDAVGLEKARLAAPTDPIRPYAPLPELDVAGIDPEAIFADYDKAVGPLPFEPNKGGSNNWVVSGKRSASGKPMLAGDPHRALLTPSLRYLVHLNAPGWNVIGAGEPALPGVAIGHNERMAWAFTIVNTDQADLYVEQTHPDDPTQYRIGDQWQAMEIVKERVAVRGQSQPTEIELRFTKHGPVIHEDPKQHRAYVLRWVGSEPGAAAYLASLRLDRAKSAQDFVAALSAWKIPALNMVYADVAGNIGWVASGGVPKRNGWDGLLPVPGNVEKYQWQGFLPVAELPQIHNPERGYVATANHNILPPDYKQTISYEWSPPYRYEEIERRLDAQEKFTLDDFRSIQHDSTSIPGQRLAAMLKAIDPKSPSLKTVDTDCVRMLGDWDGVLSQDSRAGVLYGHWLPELFNAFYGPQVPAKFLSFVRGNQGTATMLAALESSDPAWFGTAASQTARDEMLTTTLAKALVAVRKRFPNYPVEGTWGELHTAKFTHPLGRLGPEVSAAFNLAPVGKPGDGYTPNATSHNSAFVQTNGATYRQVFDLADWDKGLATSAPGQSGQPGSPHYGDLLPLWAGEEYFPLAYSRAKVESVAQHRLLLRPGEKQARVIQDRAVRSGLQPHEQITSVFEPVNFTGAYADQPHCLVCENGLNPVAMVMARDVSEPLLKLLAKLDAATTAAAKDQMGSFCIFLGNDEPLEQRVRQAAKTRAWKSLVLATHPESDLKEYKLAPEADVTVMLYSRHEVLTNHTFRRDELTDAAVDRVLADVPKLLNKE